MHSTIKSWVKVKVQTSPFSFLVNSVLEKKLRFVMSSKLWFDFLEPPYTFSITTHTHRLIRLLPIWRTGCFLGTHTHYNTLLSATFCIFVFFSLLYLTSSLFCLGICFASFVVSVFVWVQGSRCSTPLLEKLLNFLVKELWISSINFVSFGKFIVYTKHHFWGRQIVVSNLKFLVLYRIHTHTLKISHHKQNTTPFRND